MKELDDPFSFFDAYTKVDICQLRARHPTWKWQATRNGMGWSYTGTFAEHRVDVVACSCLRGYDDDDSFDTVWHVYTSNDSIPYWSWQSK